MFLAQQSGIKWALFPYIQGATQNFRECTTPEMIAKVSEVILEDRRPKKACRVRSNIKSMLIIFWDIRGIVHKEFVPPGQTVNGKFYCEVLRRLRKNVRRKLPEMWKNRNWLLHHDNAPAYTSLVVREFLTKNNVTTVPHPAYSPDLAPCDF